MEKTKESVRMTRKIEEHKFIWEGMPYIIVFTPTEGGYKFNIIYEHNSKNVTKGEINGLAK